jgi:hypothetical protein
MFVLELELPNQNITNPQENTKYTNCIWNVIVFHFSDEYLLRVLSKNIC